MIGTTISHYKILEKLGEGGMGVVYKAQDTKLDRIIALKFLPHHLTSSEAEQVRFLQEAKAAAALNHPNVCSVIDIQEANGQQFILMEYVDGVTLRKKAPVAKVNEAIGYAIQIGEALRAAHDKGIVHRDVKSENVMVTTDGRVKVMDFGLAKLKGSLKLTKTSSTVGTLAYMAPEQIQGGEVEARSDIFSFGVVLFEMLTGKLPFRGEHDAAMMYSIVNEEPDSILKYCPEISPGFDHIIHRALEKDPEDRYQSVADMVSELRREQKQSGRVVRPAILENSSLPQSLEGARRSPLLRINNRTIVFGILGVMLGAVATLWYFSAGHQNTIESLAVMPFVNESGNADIEYLSDGMTETLISSLSQLPKLNVKARSTVFRYKGKEFNLQNIAKELKVQAILTGRVVQRGDQLTLSLELVDAQTENAIWSEQYNRKQADLITLQSEIARDVSNKLKIKLSGADAAKVEKTYTANAEAYQLYLKGRFYGSKRTAKDAQKAIEFYQQAVGIDPKYALAYAGLAEANWFLALYSYPQVNEAVPKARELALKALELDSSLAEPHSVLGAICFGYDRDMACGVQEQKRATELNPNYVEGHRRYGLYLYELGRFEEARIALRRALEIDPLSPVTNFGYGQLLFFERKYEESETASKKNVELDPNFWYAHLQLFYVYRMKRDYASAVEELAKVQDSRGEPDAAKFIRESFAGGDWPGFLKKITGDRTRLKLYPFFVATFFAELGEKDKAFTTLNEAIETKDQHTGQMKVDPLMDPLRDDPRFKEVLKKAGFPE